MLRSLGLILRHRLLSAFNQRDFGFLEKQVDLTWPSW